MPFPPAFPHDFDGLSCSVIHRINPTEGDRARMRNLRPLVLLGLLTACGGAAPQLQQEQHEDVVATPASQPAPERNITETLAYSPALGVDFSQMTRSATGVYSRDIMVGTGPEASAGKMVVVHFNAFLPDGTRFDNSRDFDEPKEFTLGSGAVIRGWDEGMRGMKVGGKRLLVIPPDQAYGQAGAPVPPGSTVVYEVELLEVHE
jgi:FKBP-type peptidyl-prolyl cis-trans isomerase FkpA